MKFFTRMAVLFYVTLVLFLIGFLTLFVMQWVQLKDVFSFLSVCYFDPTLRMVLTVFTLALFFLNFMFYRIFSVNTGREKTIAFDNPSGRVRVSLSALEDLIRRQIIKMAEIKEVKLVIRATRKGLQTKIRLSLRSEMSIPEITTNVQDLVKKKLQDIIGLEEPVNVTIFIGKINPEQTKERVVTPHREEKKEPSVPFQGYRA